MSAWVYYLVIDHALAVPGPATLGEIVDCSKLNESWEHKGIAHCNEPVHGGGVGHFRQWVTGTNTQSCHGQYGRHTCKTQEMEKDGLNKESRIQCSLNK